jgi:hypothetical protein
MPNGNARIWQEAAQLFRRRLNGLDAVVDVVRLSAAL